jgi:hypothetical protein
MERFKIIRLFKDLRVKCYLARTSQTCLSPTIVDGWMEIMIECGKAIITILVVDSIPLV